MSSLTEQDRADLVAFLDGELDGQRAQALEAKLNVDPQARAEADALRQTWGLLDYLPKSEPSPTFTHRTLERLTVERTGLAPRRRSWWLPLAGWTATALVAFSVGLGVERLVTHPAAEADLSDEAFIQHLRIVEKWRLYESADDLEFARQLAQPDLFGADPGS